MRNISILFSSVSSVVFLFGIALYFITHDPVVMKFTAITSIAFILATVFVLSFALESNECKIRRQHQYDNEQERIWDKFNESERSVFEELATSERLFSDRINALWDEIADINDRCEKSPSRKK